MRIKECEGKFGRKSADLGDGLAVRVEGLFREGSRA